MLRRPLQIAAALLGLSVSASACALGYFRPLPVPMSNRDSPVAIADDFWEVQLARSPLLATRLGDRRFDAVLPDLGGLARREVAHKHLDLLRRLQDLNPGQLAPSAWRTARFLAHLLGQEEEVAACRLPLWQLSPFDGLHTQLIELGEVQVVDSSAAATAYVTRLGGVPSLLEQQQANLRDGIKEGWVAPRLLVQRVIDQLLRLEAPAGAGALDAALLQPVQAATGLSTGDAQSLHDDVCAALRDSVRPALRAHRLFLEQSLRPAARDSLSLSAQPGGEACYRQLFSAAGAAPSTPAQIHDAAQEELERQHEAMLELAQAQGFTSVEPYQAFLRHAKAATAPPASDAELLQALRRVVARATAALPQIYALEAPLAPLQVVARSELLLPLIAAEGRYLPGARHRPARFAVVPAALRGRPFAAAEAQAFAATVPGAHLQHAIGLQAADLPAARRHLQVPGFAAGWEIYAMHLAAELNLYSSPAARFGMLDRAAHQAALVQVDTGLHALGWTRQQAVDLLRENLGLEEREAALEVERCAAAPGQALAGPLTAQLFWGLRQQAKRALGKHFDGPSFHRRLLGDGPLPAAVLRDEVGIWLSGAQSRLLTH